MKRASWETSFVSSRVCAVPLRPVKLRVCCGGESCGVMIEELAIRRTGSNDSYAILFMNCTAKKEHFTYLRHAEEVLSSFSRCRCFAHWVSYTRRCGSQNSRTFQLAPRHGRCHHHLCCHLYDHERYERRKMNIVDMENSVTGNREVKRSTARTDKGALASRHPALVSTATPPFAPPTRPWR